MTAAALERLGFLRAQQVVVHERFRATAVSRANRLVDPPVQLRRLPPIVRSIGSRPTPLVKEGRHHVDDRRENRVAGRRRDGAMKADVVNEKGLWIVNGREAFRDLLGDRRQVFGTGTIGGETGHSDLEHPARFEHFLGTESVQRSEEPERLGSERRRTIRDEGARTVAGLEHAHRCKRPQPRTQTRAAHAELLREPALGGKALPRPEPAPFDQSAQVRQHLLGSQRLGWTTTVSS